MKFFASILISVFCASSYAGTFRMGGIINADDAAVVTGSQSNLIVVAGANASAALAGVMAVSNAVDAVAPGAALGLTAIQAESDPIAGLALTTETNRAQVAESGLSVSIASVNVIATNAATNSLLAVVASASKLGGTEVTNALVAYLGSNTVPSATEAMYLHGTNGNYSWEMVAGVLTIYEVTNTASVYVKETSGEGYNGPAVGTRWDNPAVVGSAWSWGTVNGYEFFSPDGEVSSVFELDTFCITGVYPQELPALPLDVQWQREQIMPCHILPVNAYAVGIPTVDWVPATNTYTLGAPASVTLTNGTVMADGVLSGTNGVYFTKTGTNYWILLN